MLKRELDDLKEDEWALTTTGAHGDTVKLWEAGYPPSALAHIGNRDMTMLRAAWIVEAAQEELRGAMMDAKMKKARR
jgi:hypothetical protein